MHSAKGEKDSSRTKGYSPCFKRWESERQEIYRSGVTRRVKTLLSAFLAHHRRDREGISKKHDNNNDRLNNNSKENKSNNNNIINNNNNNDNNNDSYDNKGGKK